MRIRTKIISLLALAFAALGVLEICVQKYVVLPSFAELERDGARTSMKRVGFALDAALESLSLAAADWGNWQDLYDYVRSPGPQFINANITPIAFKQLQVEALLVADAGGRVVLARARDPDTGGIVDLGGAGRDAILRGLPSLHAVGDIAPAHGLIRTPGGVMMIAAAPILDGSGLGRPAGQVVMARRLDDKLMRQLAAQAQAAVTIADAVAGAPGERIEERGDVTRITRAFDAIDGRPVIDMRVDLPRRITARGHVAVAYASLYLIGAATAVLFLAMLVLDRVVIKPLARVTRHAVQLGEGNDLTLRLDLPGSDEIATLARELDRMLERVAESRRQSVDHSFQAGFAEVARGVLHNLGNAMTPLGVRLSNLDERLHHAPLEDLDLAFVELGDETPGTERHADLEEFVRLGCRELAAAIREARADVDVIQRQASMVQGALSELMRSTRNEHVVEAVALPDLVSQTLEIVPDDCRRRLVIETDDSLRRLGTVRIARTVLRLVLQNLVINAADAVRDAGRERGTLRVAASIVDEAGLERLHLRCEDDGVGIPPSDLGRVFDKGFSTKSRETNHGIGLHWCANAIAALGGKIWAASEGTGRGTALHLIVPLGVRAAPNH